MTESLNIILIIFIVISAVAATRVRDLISAVFLMGCYSFFLAVLWALLAAVDVAFTEAMVGVGASTIFFLLALFGSHHSAGPVPFGRLHVSALILVSLFGGLLVWGSLDMPWFGAITAPADIHVSPFYLENSLLHSHTPNAVTAVVVDYRAFDTLIEATVIFTAGVACFLIFKPRDGQ